MKGRGLFNLFLLFEFLFFSTKLIQARSNVLHDGVLDSMAYDPNLLSMLQMEQSLDLDDDESAYLGTSLLDKAPSFLQQGCSRHGSSCSKTGSFLQQTSTSSDDDDFDDGGDDSFLEEEDQDQDLDEDESFLEEQDDEKMDDMDEDEDNDAESLLESESTSSSTSTSSSSETLSDDDLFKWSSPGVSYLETSSTLKKTLSPSTFGSLIQLHNVDSEPLNFLQDETLLLMNDQNNEEDYDEEPKTTNVKAYVLKSDNPEPDLGDTLDETTAQQLLSTVKAYKVWVVVVVVLLLIAVVVRLYYLDKFMKFKTELWTKLDNFNKAVVGKWNNVFKKNQVNDNTTEASDENTPLLNA